MTRIFCITFALLLQLFVSGPLFAADKKLGDGLTSKKKWTQEGFVKPEKIALKKALSAEQYSVTQEEGTERAFTSSLNSNKQSGLYVDIVSGEPLFLSTDKFDSGTGWPSFTKPIAEQSVVKREDRKLWMKRTEVSSKIAGSHLGHVFDDGPAPTGLRYCINGAALRFIPAGDLEAEGYGAWASHFSELDLNKAADKNSNNKSSSAQKSSSALAEKNSMSGSLKGEIATLAGGCFWGVEELFRTLPGVAGTRVGYTGGSSSVVNYEMVKTGKTGHAEAIEVAFDPAKISYEDILLYFFRLHDPTTLNRQGNDIGTQYRSAVFYHGEQQRITAEAVKEKISKSGKWSKPVVTEIIAASEFHSAEDYHQKYLEKNPGGYTCHFLRD